MYIYTYKVCPSFVRIVVTVVFVQSILFFSFVNWFFFSFALHFDSIDMNFTVLLSRQCLLTIPSSSKRFPFTISVWRSFSGRPSQTRLLYPKNVVKSELRKDYQAAKPKPSGPSKDYTLREFRRIVRLVSPYKMRVFAGFCCLCVGSVIQLSIPRIFGKITDEMAKKGGEIDTQKKEEAMPPELTSEFVKHFKNSLFFIAFLLIVGACATGARTYLMHTAGQLIVNDLRTGVFNAVLRQDMAFFDRNKVGEIVSRLSADAFIVGNSVSSNLSEGMRSLFMCFGSLGLMIYTSWELSGMCIILLPLVVLSFYKFGKKQKYYTLQIQRALSQTNQLATERFSNIRTVKIFSAEAAERQSYRNKILEIWGISRQEGMTKALMLGGTQLTVYITLSALLYYGGVLIADGCLTYGDLLSFMFYSVYCSYNFSNLQEIYAEQMRGLGAAARLFELRDQKPLIPAEGGFVISVLKKGIRFESIAFSYPNRMPIFNDISFQIPKASITAIVGPSGSGKSTIAHLLLRLYCPTVGRIMVDDVDLKQLDLSSWRRMIGTVSQEPSLFSTSIRDNILYGVDKNRLVTEEELTEVAEQANCLEFVKSFPDGFNTLLGEHGALLSGGQRQRIAIARALIKKPQLLILDEATSALDATSEYLVRKALDALLEKSGQTVLIIAHRLSTIKHADQIVVLDKGTVAELGTFSQLMAIKDGIFFRLVEKQTFDWENEKF